MFNLTRQERTVLLSLMSVVLFAALIRYAFKMDPRLKDWINLADSEAVYYKINVNTADREELLRIPYIGEKTAEVIIEYRLRQAIKSVDELKDLPRIREEHFNRFRRHLCTDRC